MQMDEKQRIRNAVDTRTWEALRSLTGSTYASNWILFHRYVLTSDGSLYPLTTDTDFEPSFDQMVSMEDLKRVCPGKCISWSCRRLPSVDDVCLHCGKGFDVLTGATAYWSGDAWYHQKCNEILLHVSAEKFFRDVCDRVFGAASYILTPIPNGYGGGDNSPWFTAETSEGVIFKMGWRRSVILLDWSKWKGEEGPKASTFPPFRSEEVTKDGCSIHAWSKDSFERYLRTMHEHSKLSVTEVIELAIREGDLDEVDRAVLTVLKPKHTSNKYPYLGPKIPLKVLREAAKLTSGKYSTCNFYLKEELRPFGF